MPGSRLRFRAARPAVVALAALLAACTAAMRPDPVLDACRALFVEADARSARAGAEDHGARRVPGFDWLRVDRFLASFRESTLEPERFETWIERLRRLDLDARAAELPAAGAPELLPRLDDCGRRLAAADAADPARRDELRRRAAVLDDYSLAGRVLGFYPVAVPFLRHGIAAFQRRIGRDYAIPAADLTAPGPLVPWQPAPAAEPGAEEVRAWLARTDALGIPRLDAGQWRRLLAAHAPRFLVETAGAYDEPGSPILRDGVAALDTAQARVYGLGAYTRRGGRILAQLVYVLWFAERPPAGRFDPYAGWLDGVIWRVTLDAEGGVLLYDTIHSCGCYHLAFPVAPLRARSDGGYWDERVLQPQGRVPPGPVAVRLQSGTHYVRRVLPAAAPAAAAARTYELGDYREMLALRDGRGGVRSLFGDGGLVAGSERAERWWLWVSGVVSPGTMRQWGRHATAFVGRRHFDDPDLIDRLFLADE
ncbi:MAG: hypothetical protein HYV18_09475 [Gammaproteobacteria bacterium]|nr:hypothetical protein [Gammaproteobacteria bacterium]